MVEAAPLVVCVTGSLSGAEVSTAIWIGQGGAAFTGARGAATWASAATEGASAAAAPASDASFRNLSFIASCTAASIL
jgi:hypothetical protein